MKIDFTKKNDSKLPFTSLKFARRGLPLLAICTAVCLIGSLSIYIFYYHASSLKTLMTTVFNHPSQKPVNETRSVLEIDKKMQQLAENNPDQIHFEFYSTLPNAQVNLETQSPNNTEQLKKTDGQKETSAKLTMHNKKHDIQSFPSSLKEQSQKISSPLKGKLFHTFRATNLEHAFSQHVHPRNYIVQLAVFKKLEMAKKFREKHNKDGLEITITTIKRNNENAYRVELGPYTSLQQSKLAQQKMKQKGINSLIVSIKKG